MATRALQGPTLFDRKNHRGLSGVASDTAAFPTLKEAGLKTFHGFLRAIFDREILAFNEAKATGHATLA